VFTALRLESFDGFGALDESRFSCVALPARRVSAARSATSGRMATTVALARNAQERSLASLEEDKRLAIVSPTRAPGNQIAERNP